MILLCLMWQMLLLFSMHSQNPLKWTTGQGFALVIHSDCRFCFHLVISKKVTLIHLIIMLFFFITMSSSFFRTELIKDLICIDSKNKCCTHEHYKGGIWSIKSVKLIQWSHEPLYSLSPKNCTSTLSSTFCDVYGSTTSSDLTGGG